MPGLGCRADRIPGRVGMGPCVCRSLAVAGGPDRSRLSQIVATLSDRDSCVWPPAGYQTIKMPNPRPIHVFCIEWWCLQLLVE